jgi:hypothetical protein
MRQRRQDVVYPHNPALVFFDGKAALGLGPPIDAGNATVGAQLPLIESIVSSLQAFDFCRTTALLICLPAIQEKRCRV